MIKKEDLIEKTLLILAGLSFVSIAVMIIFLAKEAAPALSKLGLKDLFFSSVWQPKDGQYGILVFITGTILTSVGGMLLGAPPALASAIFLTEISSKRLALVLTGFIELLAGIPSIVFGWIGFITIIPIIRNLTKSPGVGILAASIILSMMILPTITLIAADAIKAVPESYRQASLGLGATRWQTIRRVTLPAAKRGLTASVILGLGRAIGETMAVAMVIGPASVYAKSLTTPTHTLTTKILIEMGESWGLHRSALFVMALVLLLVSMILIYSINHFSSKRDY